ncbi:MAG TPA: PAS domain S-box protein, partial [Actinomycetota bacterium]|nr:PAS domain S-box protein [Actinomycetota bacterium]
MGIVAVLASVRRPNAKMRSLAVALGLLGTLPTLSLLSAAAPSQWSAVIARASAVVFLSSGFALLVFRHRLIPLDRRVLWALGAASVAAAGAAIGTGLDAAGARGPAQMAAALSLMAVWVACVGEPTYRFWRTARLRPIIQRARLRALAAGYFGVIVVAVISRPSNDNHAIFLASQIVVAFVIPLLWIALHPPSWLRRSWQSRERISRAALDAMVRHIGDERSLAARSLTWARTIVGGEGAALVDADGSVLGLDGIDEDTVRALRAAAPPGEAAMIDYNGGAVVAPVPLEAGSGSLIVTSGPLSPLFDAHETDEVAAFASTVAIALERVRTLARHRDQAEHYAGVVQAMGDLGEGFLVTDGRRLLFANDAYCRLTGYSLEELMAMPSLEALAPPDELERLQRRRTERLRGAAVVDSYDSALIRKDGERVELEVSMKILGTEDKPSIVCIVRDITDRKRAEDRLRAALEREHDAVRRLESLDEMKNAFLSAVSHELRTPLTGVLGFARTLQSLGDTMDQDDRTNVV